jgi:uncharacterized protein
MGDRIFLAPPQNPESEPYYRAAAEGKFLLRRCTSCNRAHWYPRAICPFCAGATDWQEASGDATIYSYSVMRRTDLPYAIAYVTLAEGPVMMTNIVDSDFEALGIGQRVRVVFKPSDGGAPVPCFRVA